MRSNLHSMSSGSWNMRGREGREGTYIRVSKTFLEMVQVMPAMNRSCSWPQIAEKNEEIYCEGWFSTPASIPSKSEAQLEQHVDSKIRWHSAHGLHPDDSLWNRTSKLMIRSIPARCTYEELEALVRISTACEFQLSLPLNKSGRNRGYAFVTVPDAASMRSLVRAMWGQSVPTRCSRRALLLQPANWEHLTQTHSSSQSLGK
ncbi:unnamed protein product [Symbiodinium necroappetens]|uniref:RRM domain-containing protein n=1 Tax=Symbiodinium necroappetens TaxID=1628268 RepID=A0A813A146_9DINO|nr:unnamed protein product [Symbiodinium necroappetens]